MRIVLATIIAIAAASGPLRAQQTINKYQLIGTWKVLNLKATTGQKVAYPLGEQVAGYVTITPTRLWLLFFDAARKTPAAAAPTDAKAVAMIKSQMAWTGKYVTDEPTGDTIKLKAHVDAASNPAIIDTDRVYFLRRDGDRLLVKSPDVIVPKTGATSIIEFELKAE